MQTKIAVYKKLHCCLEKFARLPISIMCSVTLLMHSSKEPTIIFLLIESFSLFSKYFTVASLSMKPAFVKFNLFSTSLLTFWIMKKKINHISIYWSAKFTQPLRYSEAFWRFSFAASSVIASSMAFFSQSFGNVQHSLVKKNFVLNLKRLNAFRKFQENLVFVLLMSSQKISENFTKAFKPCLFGK